jgi:hypothetical protein
MRPCSALVGLAQTATEQMLDQAVLGATLVGLGSGAADQITQGFVLWRWHPDRRGSPAW